jgi:hypothetical protein
MLEYWNDGIMGSGKMGLWDIGNITLDKEVNSIHKTVIFFQRPTFHYSIIPFFHV